MNQLKTSDETAARLAELERAAGHWLSDDCIKLLTKMRLTLPGLLADRDTAARLLRAVEYQRERLARFKATHDPNDYHRPKDFSDPRPGPKNREETEWFWTLPDGAVELLRKELAAATKGER